VGNGKGKTEQRLRQRSEEAGRQGDNEEILHFVQDDELGRDEAEAKRVLKQEPPVAEKRARWGTGKSKTPA
jgi:hypothetical protein